MIPLSTGALDRDRGRRCALRRYRDRHGRHAADPRQSTIRDYACADSCSPAAAPSVRPRSIDALAAFCPGADVEVTVLDIPDGRAPAHWERIKDHLSEFRRSCTPQVVFGPQRGDAHQDHRLLAELLPTEFRDHLVLGYEILKWEADTPRPTIFHPLDSRGGRGEGAPAAQALSVAGEPRLVRRASVSRPVQAARACSAAASMRRPSFWKRRPSHSSAAASPSRTASRSEGTGMRVLVTGHQGYLGTVMVPILQAAGHDVTGLDSGFFADCVLGPAPADPPGIRVDLRDVTVEQLGRLRRSHSPRGVVQRPARCTGTADHLRHQPPRVGPAGTAGQRGGRAPVPLRVHLLGVRVGRRGPGDRETLRCDR